eukprot:6192830-Pleurochrysis_carterae.AAC.1
MVNVSSADVVTAGTVVTKRVQHIDNHQDVLVFGTPWCGDGLVIDAHRVKWKRRVLHDLSSHRSTTGGYIAIAADLAVLTHLLAVSKHTIPIV